MHQAALGGANRLPSRYQREWGAEFWELVRQALVPGVAVLDVGSGRRPTISPSERPARTHYVGLDASAAELHAAPAGAYDQAVVGDAETVLPVLVGRFDLIVSWYVLEHIPHLDRAASNFYEYARPGGSFVACLAGRNAVFAVANRLLPSAIGAKIVARLRQRPPESVFATHYDHCTDHGLLQAFERWDSVDVISFWHAADYFDRLPRVQRLYLRYENWAACHTKTALSTHYVVAARKATR